jgi:hypothetical protein
MLGALLRSRSDLSIRNGVLLYKQFIRPVLRNACPIWRYAARTYVKNLHVVPSKCLHNGAIASSHVSNKPIHYGTLITLASALAQRLLVRERLVGTKASPAIEGSPKSPEAAVVSDINWWAGTVRGKTANSTQRNKPSIFRPPSIMFSAPFSSCKANGKLCLKVGHGRRLLPWP